MAGAVLTLVLTFVVAGGLWLTLGPRFALAADEEQNSLLNLAAYVVVLLPLMFVLVFFVVERL